MAEDKPFIDSLTRKERLIYAMCLLFPDAVEYKLAEKIGVNSSTYSMVKRKLIRKGYLIPMYVPDIRYLNLRLLSVASYQFPEPSGKTLVEQMDELPKEVVDNWVFGVSSKTKGFVISAYNDVETAKMSRDIVTRMKLDHGQGRIDDTRFTNLVPSLLDIYRIEPSKNLIFYSFKGYLDELEDIYYSLDQSDLFEERKMPMSLGAISDISNKQKAALKHLLSLPVTSDENIANKIGLSRISIYRLRMSLLASKVIKYMNIPNFKALGLDVLTLCRTYMNTKMHGVLTKIEKNWKGVDPKITNTINKIFSNNFGIMGDSVDLIMFNLFRGLEDAEEFDNAFDELHRKCNNRIFKPEVTMISLKNANLYGFQEFPIDII